VIHLYILVLHQWMENQNIRKLIFSWWNKGKQIENLSSSSFIRKVGVLK
jgi:hypothetical protein